tara:strand:+ start:1479 stop:1901 length:423 start_codon:yes stop_codon:yes gene_type:complete
MKNTATKIVTHFEDADGNRFRENDEAGTRTLGYMTKAELALLAVQDYRATEGEKKGEVAAMPMVEQCMRAPLVRKLAGAELDAELEFTATEVTQLQTLFASFGNYWPFTGVVLDVVDLVQEVNEMAGTVVEAKGPKVASA